MTHGSAAEPEKDMTRTYALVVIVEIVVIALLFWLGKSFG